MSEFENGEHTFEAHDLRDELIESGLGKTKGDFKQEIPVNQVDLSICTPHTSRTYTEESNDN